MKTIDSELLGQLRALARASPRLRSHINWHDPAQDTVQRFFVHALPRSYVRPHRHLIQRRFELSVVLDGAADLLLFDDGGTLRDIVALRTGGSVRGVELSCDMWHSYRVTGASVTLLEVKEGPYDAAADKDFATWAPAESAADVPAFLDWLEDAHVGACWPGAAEIAR